MKPGTKNLKPFYDGRNSNNTTHLAKAANTMQKAMPGGTYSLPMDSYNSVIPDKGWSYEGGNLPSARAGKRSTIQDIPKSPARTAAKSLTRVASSTAKAGSRRVAESRRAPPTAKTSIVTTDHMPVRRQILNKSESTTKPNFVKKSSNLNLVPKSGVGLRSNQPKKVATPPRAIKSATSKNAGSTHTRKAIREFLKNTDDVPMVEHENPEQVFLDALKERCK